MSKIEYVPQNFRRKSIDVIDIAESICQDYANRGFDLTLRQIYYQLVARDLIPNRDTEYDKLGATLSNARLGGKIDWLHMIDRTRYLRAMPGMTTPQTAIERTANDYTLDFWNGQDYHVEVWIEKDALVGVLQNVCYEERVGYTSCRGYMSQSEVWSAAMRFCRKMRDERKKIVVLHFGDHDPSGIDMTRDITDRLSLFCTYHGYEAPAVERVALNMDQIELYNPPPNPAKVADIRYQGYVDTFGTDESWELDALDPNVIEDLVRENVRKYRDDDLFEAMRERAERERDGLLDISRNYTDIHELVSTGGDDLIGRLSRNVEMLEELLDREGLY